MQGRGWLFVLAFFWCAHVMAFSWDDMWHNKFQQGVSSYRAKKFQSAVGKFSRFDDAAANYNRGNSLALSNKLKEAVDAYDKALKQNPGMQDAKYNCEIVKKMMEQKKKQEDKSNNNQEKDNDKKDKKNKKDKDDKKKGQDKQDQKNNQAKNKEDESKQNKGKEGENKQKNSDDDSKEKEKQSQNQMQQADKKKNEEQKPKKQPQPRVSQKQQERNQSEKQLLNQIPDDPGGLLRRKFERDYQRRQMEANGW